MIAGLPAWLDDEGKFGRGVASRVREDLQTFGLLQGSVATFQWPQDEAGETVKKRRWPKTLEHGTSGRSPRHTHTPNAGCPDLGVTINTRLVANSAWPFVQSISVECLLEEGLQFIPEDSFSFSNLAVPEQDWAEDVWSARLHREQLLLSGLSAAGKADFAGATPGRDERFWQQHAPRALAELLSELILNCAMHDAAAHLESTMLETLHSLPNWPSGPLDFDKDFPPLQSQDAYCDAGKQWSPRLFLKLAALVWSAASQGISSLQASLQALRQTGLPLDQLALNTPVIYRSGGRSRSLSGPLLMFVVDQMTKIESTKEMVQTLVTGKADVNSSYVLFPTGKHKAVGRFPVLCLAGNRQALDVAEALLSKRADANREITLSLVGIKTDGT